jgi:predicted dehydrogenase
MPGITTRRHLLSAALAGAGYFVAAGSPAQTPKSPNERLRFASVGVGGRGGANTAEAAKHGDIVVLCDIDDNTADKSAQTHSQAKRYFDFRKALEENRDSLDAVVISTPDHTHAVITSLALRMGKHVYCEKPLCRYLGEGRALARLAETSNLAMQMGNQGAASAVFRRTVDAVRSGAIGVAKEVHAWSAGPNWQGNRSPTPTASVPATMHWNEFVGPAALQPYSNEFHPSKWQGWWAFGNGALGNSVCHMLHLAFHALDLRNPSTITAEHSGHNRISYPKSSLVKWTFPATRKRPEIKLTWYDGGRRPEAALLDGEPFANEGCLIVGDQGKLLTNTWSNDRWMRLPERANFNPSPALDHMPPPPPSHFHEFVEAIRNGGTTMSNFVDAAIPLTEIMLLGNLAIWADKPIEWDAAKSAVKDASELGEAITPKYRQGYELG